MMEELGRRRLIRLSLGAATAGGLGAMGLAGAPHAAASADCVAGEAFRRAMRFWFDFDNATQFNKPPEMDEAWAAIGKHLNTSDPPPRPMWQRFREFHQSPGYPDNFITYMTPIKGPLEVMSRIQAPVFDQYYPWGGRLLTEAFSYFGQGVLYDPDRPAGQPRVHTMGRKPPTGYHVWHIFMRGMIYLDIDPCRWRRIAPRNALAWAIQSIAKPDEQKPNPPLPGTTIRDLKRYWLRRSLNELDTAFESFPYPAGIN